MRDLSFLKEAPKDRSRTDVNREAPASVVRDGGDFKAGLISKVSLIQKGEALGPVSYTHLTLPTILRV